MKHPSPVQLTIALTATTLLAYAGLRLLAPGPAPSAGVFGPDAAGTAAAIDPLANLPDALPEISLHDIDGTLTSLASWSGKPLIVNFWATWCAPCLREIPLLKQLQADRPDLTVIGIAVDRPEPVADFAAEMEFNYPVLVGQADAMDAASAFGLEVFVLPSTVFVAADGGAVGRHVGELHTEHLDNATAAFDALGAGSVSLGEARAQFAGHR